MFERRIMGLISYYVGATADLYAKKNLFYVNLTMSEYQYNIYRVFEKLEHEIMTRAKKRGKSSQLYRTYTRQACNFVFPYVNINVNGELRPRPGKFKISDKISEQIARGLENKVAEDPNIKDYISRYMSALNVFVAETEKYFRKINDDDVKNGRTILDDINDFKTN